MKKRTVKFLTGLQIEASLADNIIETGCIVPILSTYISKGVRELRELELQRIEKLIKILPSPQIRVD